MNEIVKLAYDSYKGNVSGNYSHTDTMDVLRQALVDANNGSTKLDYKAIRDGKCNGLFSIIEEVIQRTVVDELQGNEFFMNFVDYKNLALGDKNEFYIPSNSLFVISDISEGNQGLRRQRLNAGTQTSVNTQLKGVKIYEELNRVLAGRVDFNQFIAIVSRSFKKKNFKDIYNVWNNITASTLGATYYPTAGTYSEEALIDVVSHVEAASDQSPIIVCTKKATRKLTTAVQSDSAKEDLYDMGYYGKFNGTPIVTMKQTHKDNTSTFLLDDDKYYVIATDEKPIKYVTEGESILLLGDPMAKADMVQEFMYAERYGTGFIMPDQGGLGIYEIA